MLSKQEREYLKNPDAFSPNYQRVMSHRIGKKLDAAQEDLMLLAKSNHRLSLEMAIGLVNEELGKEEPFSLEKLQQMMDKMPYNAICFKFQNFHIPAQEKRYISLLSSYPEDLVKEMIYELTLNLSLEGTKGGNKVWFYQKYPQETKQ